ncbi:MAG: sulfite exporter TauE/SafE family protein [Bacteroidota bacterium]
MKTGGISAYLPVIPILLNLLSFLPWLSQSPEQLLVIGLVAFLVGMAKTGVHGAGMMSVPLLAVVFGGQASSGMMLPVLVLADIMGVWYYHRHASWPHLRGLFPWAAAGVVFGTVAGLYMDERMFRSVMAVIILISVGIMIFLERKPESVPSGGWFAGATGIAGGFTSMVGNLANAVMAVYFLSVRLPKNIFIGTTAWFFLVVNLFKMPFHLFFWKTIHADTFFTAATMLPLIGLGACCGVLIVRRFSERGYRWFIMAMTVISAVGMLAI